MDGFFYRTAYALGRAMKDWPLATLIVVCTAALLAIPVTLTTKRVLDHFWLGRDEYISMLSEHNGILKKEVKEWKEVASKARSAEVALVQQVSGLQSELANLQSHLSNARDKEIELTRQADRWQKNLTSCQIRLSEARDEEIKLNRRLSQQCNENHKIKGRDESTTKRKSPRKPSSRRNLFFEDNPSDATPTKKSPSIDD